MLSMPCLNIRSTQAMTMVHTKLGQLSAHSVPAELHGDYQAPRSGVGCTQPELQMDSYQSRKAYGYKKLGDLTREFQQEGFQGADQGRSHHTQNAWNFIDNAAKPGRNVIAEQAMQGVRQQIAKRMYLEVQAIPDVEIQVTPSRLVGQNDPGHAALSIDAQPFAETDFQPGSVSTEVTQEADVRQWVTYGHYDLLA